MELMKLFCGEEDSLNSVQTDQKVIKQELKEIYGGAEASDDITAKQAMILRYLVMQVLLPKCEGLEYEEAALLTTGKTMLIY